MPFMTRARDWARKIKRDTVTVYFAARDTRTPLLIKTLALVIAAYALSPIDLIPDFIPVLGYLDDLLIVPLGLWFITQRLPAEVLAGSRAKADAICGRPKSYVAATGVVIIWLLCIGGLTYRWLASP